jgi:hypothetical protein
MATSLPMRDNVTLTYAQLRDAARLYWPHKNDIPRISDVISAEFFKLMPALRT